MKHITKITFRAIFYNNPILPRFSTSSPRPKSSQNGVPIRIPFEQENLHHINDVFSLSSDKKQLDATHKQFLEQLTNTQAKGKHLFEHFENSNKTLYDYIRKDILKEEGFQADSQFIKRSHYYFQSEGKKIRPTMVKMIANCLGKSNKETDEKVQKWGALIEMMHISSLAHDDIIDDSPSRRGMQSQHLRYGKRSAVFSANFIIAKASKTIHDFNSSKLYEIYSTTMDNLATGQIIQAASKAKINSNTPLKEEVATYVNKSYYKTAALMANAMRGVPLFFDSSSEQEIASFRVGQHFGIAFQLVDDILDYTSTPQEMGKQTMADIAEGHVTGPVYFSLLTEVKEGKPTSYVISQLRNKNKDKERTKKIQEWVFANRGVELTFALADLHIKRGLEFLSAFPNSNLDAWKYLGYKLLSRKK